AHPYAVTGVTSVTGSYQYDANGNMICKDATGSACSGGASITWNMDNLPTVINAPNGNSSTFSYRPDLQRYKQIATDTVAGTTTTTYVGGLFEIVTNGSSTQYRHNILASGGIVAVHTLDYMGTATTAYMHSDHLGSADSITDDTGAVVQQTSFDAFGLRRDPSDWSYSLTGLSGLNAIMNKGFTAQEQLDNVGLVHMNGRVYDPAIGRFMSSDIVVQNAFDSQSFNRFAYVHNSPLNAIDPSGFCVTADISAT